MCDMHMQNLCEIVGSNVKLVHFSLLIPKMSMFTLANICLTTSNLP